MSNSSSHMIFNGDPNAFMGGGHQPQQQQHASQMQYGPNSSTQSRAPQPQQYPSQPSSQPSHPFQQHHQHQHQQQQHQQRQMQSPMALMDNRSHFLTGGNAPHHSSASHTPYPFHPMNHAHNTAAASAAAHGHNHHHGIHHPRAPPPPPHGLGHHPSSSSLSTMSQALQPSHHSSPINRGRNHPYHHYYHHQQQQHQHQHQQQNDHYAASAALNPVVVHDHDVLSGRGVNIAQHAGNQRFRTLITTFRDQEYCLTYSAGEKRAVALQIIKQVKELNPPGRFLKRDGRGQGSRGLGGPWEELSERESIKKTCQALRDCNRQDRQGYAKGVAAPEDVLPILQEANQVPAKERAAAAAHAIAAEATSSAFSAINNAAHYHMPIKKSESANDTASLAASVSSSTKRCREEVIPAAPGINPDSMMPSGSSNSNLPSPASSYYSTHIQPFQQPETVNSNMPMYSCNSNNNSNNAAPQASGLHYQQHNFPYTSIQQQANHHHPSYHHHQQQQQAQLPMNFYNSAAALNSNPGYGHMGAPSATGQSYYSNHNNNNNNSGSSGQNPYQDALLSSLESNSAANFQQSPDQQQQQQHQQHHQNYQGANYYYSNNNVNTDPFVSNVNYQQQQHLPMINPDEQLLKKQRTEDTDPSTPSEPSPSNAVATSCSTIDDNIKIDDDDNDKHSLVDETAVNDCFTSTELTLTGHGDDILINSNHHGERTIDDSTSIQPKLDAFEEVDADDEGSSWVNGHTNNNLTSAPVPPEIVNDDKYHDALNGF